MWGLYWRYLISLVLLLTISAYLVNKFDLLNNIDYLHFKPTIVWLFIALTLSLFTIIQNKGLPYVFFGRHLSISVGVWKKFNIILALFFIVLSILNYVVNMAAGHEFWKMYKLFGQTSLLIIFPLFSAWYVVKQLRT